MQVNLLPFVIEALGNCKHIYKDIDKVYQANKYEFYKAAKESELYNHQIIKEGSLVQEEYCKKVLGIILGSGEDEKIHREIQILIKKGFRYTWIYFEKHLKIDLQDFTRAFYKKFKSYVDDTGVPVDFHSTILLFLTLNSQHKLVQDDFYNGYLANLQKRWEHYKDINKTRIGIEKASDIDKEKIKLLKEAIFKKHGPIKDFNSILDGHFEKKYLDLSAFLFDYENLSSISIFEDIKFTDKDIDEILYLYVIGNEKLRGNKEMDFHNITNLIDDTMIEDATKFLISHMYIKYLIKSYKQVKRMYFENNKETMFIELEGLEKSLSSTTEKLFSLKKDLANSENIINNLEKENARLNKELEQERRNREELNSLRSFLFSLDIQEQEKVTFDEPSFDLLKGYKAVVIGGHEKWQQRMKKLLPNFIFIHPNNLNFDTRLLDNIDALLVYTQYNNHSIYLRAMSAIEGTDTKVVYLHQPNEDKVLHNIYSVLVKSEKKN